MKAAQMKRPTQEDIDLPHAAVIVAHRDLVAWGEALHSANTFDALLMGGLIEATLDRLGRKLGCFAATAMMNSPISAIPGLLEVLRQFYEMR